jgi:hypothetical protein
MTRDPVSHAASQPSVETSRNVGKWDTARSLSAKPANAILAAALVFVTAQLDAGFAAEVERESEPITQSVEPGSAIPTKRQKSTSDDPPLDGAELRLQKKRDWWNHAREVLFSDIELGAEQERAIDATIETQLKTRVQLQQIDARLGAALKAKDSERSDAARAEFRALEGRLKKTQEIYEEMRALLAEEQRPTFDMNRAHLAAEIRESKQNRPKKRPKRTAGE